MIRTLLLKIRRLSVGLNDKQKIALNILIIIAMGAGIAIDTFLPWNFLINFIRAGIAVIVALIIFGELYILSLERAQIKMEKNEDYVPVRKRFVYKERRNLSVLMWTALFIALLMCSHHSSAYTFLNTWIFVCALSILTFVRASREEYIRNKYGIKNSDELNFDKEVETNLQIRKMKLEEKRNKKEK